jgi:hypothetical protein
VEEGVKVSDKHAAISHSLAPTQRERERERKREREREREAFKMTMVRLDKSSQGGTEEERKREERRRNPRRGENIWPHRDNEIVLSHAAASA